MLYVVECAYTDPKAKRRGIPLIRKNYRRWSLCPVSTPPSASALSARAAPATWRCTISTMLPSSTATPTAATAAAVTAGNRRSPTGIATSILRIIRCGRLPRMKCCCWAIPRRTCPSLRRYSCSQAAWQPNKAGMPPSSHETTCITWPRLPPSLSISPSPPGYATRRSAREVAMSPAPFYTLTAGDLTVTAVSDGLMSAPLSFLSGISREDAEHLQRHSGLASPRPLRLAPI